MIIVCRYVFHKWLFHAWNYAWLFHAWLFHAWHVWLHVGTTRDVYAPRYEETWSTQTRHKMHGGATRDCTHGHAWKNEVVNELYRTLICVAYIKFFLYNKGEISCKVHKIFLYIGACCIAHGYAIFLQSLLPIYIRYTAQKTSRKHCESSQIALPWFTSVAACFSFALFTTAWRTMLCEV